MAFRKRNLAIGPPSDITSSVAQAKELPPGIRLSSLTSHAITSTGTPSLDTILGGHGGLALGSSLLLEESGTTDFAGALLRYFAAQGICHGQIIHVVGVGEGWVRELPGIAEEKSKAVNKVSSDEEKMKIAWRYENLGQSSGRATFDPRLSSQASSASSEVPFCNTFDLSKRLVIPRDARVNHIPIPATFESFKSIIETLERSLRNSSHKSIHRLVIPTILNPALYPPQASRPENFIQFLHMLRALLRRYPNTITAMITLPLELYSRSSGLIRWAEILSDGVIELTPFPHLMDASNSVVESGVAKGTEEQPQGMVKVHKIPINTERGEGGAGAGNSLGEDLAFTISRRKFAIKPFSLPPVEGDQDAQKEAGKLTGKDIEF